MKENKIKLYRFEFDSLNKEFDSLRRNLTTEELARSEKKISKEIQIKSVLSRGILRHVLGKITGDKPRDMKIQKKAEGKLYLPNYPELHFNLSHSNNLMTIAISNSEIGIDIEFNKSPINESTTKIFMSAFEQSYFKSLSSSTDQKNYFYHIWTAKESLSKYLGQGLKMDFTGFSINLETNFKFTNSHSSCHGLYINIHPDYTLALCQLNEPINYEIIS